MLIHIYITYTHTHIYIYILYIYIHTHTHTHTHINSYIHTQRNTHANILYLARQHAVRFNQSSTFTCSLLPTSRHNPTSPHNYEHKYIHTSIIQKMRYLVCLHAESPVFWFEERHEPERSLRSIKPPTHVYA